MTILIPQRQIWTRQPQYPRPIDWSNLITRGLVYAIDPGVDPTRITKTGTPSISVGANGRQIEFTASGQKLTTTFSGGVSERSYLIAFKPDDQGSGPDGFSRLCETTGGIETFSASNASGLQYVAPYTSAPIWALATLTAKKDYVLCMSRSSAPAVTAYLNGSVLAVSGPSPAATGYTSSVGTYLLGNRATNDRTWDGTIGLFAVWDRVLNPVELQSLSANPWQIFAP